jgi:MarR family transcriptional regulator, organic hydroperoxide resistance regulator
MAAASSRLVPAARAPKSAARADDELPGTLQFLQLLWTVNQALELASKRMAIGLGVTGPQRLVVRLIGRSPGISAGELATTMRTDPSTLTGVLQRLQAAQLIRRVRDARDGRRVLLSLTARGRAVDRLKSGTIENAVKAAMRGVSDRDIARAARVVRRIASRVMEAGGGQRFNGNGPERQRFASRAVGKRPLRTSRHRRGVPQARR